MNLIKISWITWFSQVSLSRVLLKRLSRKDKVDGAWLISPINCTKKETKAKKNDIVA